MLTLAPFDSYRLGLFLFSNMSDETNERESLIIYRSFFESIKEIPKSSQAEVWNAVFELGFNFQESELTGISKTIFTLIRPQILANIRKYKNGKVPKQKRSKTEANDKQDRSKTEANDNDNDNDNEKGKILISFDLVLKCFETAKILARPYLDRMQEVHSLNGKQVIDYLKTWTSKNEGKTMTISHAENSFNIFLNGMQKEQPKLLYPLSSIKDNDF